MPGLTLSFGNLKKTFQTGAGFESIAEVDKAGVVKRELASSKGGTIKAQTKQEYDYLADYLSRADINKDGKIDRNDYNDLRIKEDKQGKIDPKFCTDGSDAGDAITGTYNQKYYSIFVY